MPQDTRNIVSHLARTHLPEHWRVLASQRLNTGLVKYGSSNHLRPDCAEACHKCGARIVDAYPCNYCPQCGCDVRPYSVSMECAEELLDAHNQCGIAQRRRDWPAWKVAAVAKLCGVGLALLDAREESEVREYVRLIALLSSPAELPGCDAGEL